MKEGKIRKNFTINLCINSKVSLLVRQMPTNIANVVGIHKFVNFGVI